MIYGIGSDIVELARMQRLFERYGQRLAERVLAATEMPAWQRSKDPARFLARRFAAKEAISKALGTGLRAPVTLHAIAVGHDALGKPFFVAATAALQAYWTQHGLGATHLSLSDEREYIIAFAVIEKAPACAH